MLFFRKIYFEKFKRFVNSPNILLILWARQVGKTSFVKSLIERQIIKNYIFLNWEEFLWKNYLPKDFYDFLTWEYNIQTKDFLIIDEAQNITNIGVILKYLVDLVNLWKLKIKIIILGSGSLSLFRWFTDSLIWRYDIIKIYPLTFEEFLDYKGYDLESIDFMNNSKWIYDIINNNFEEYKKFGGYPAVVFEKDYLKKKILFKNIVDAYLMKDVMWFINKQKLGLFERFLKYFIVNIWSLVKINSVVSKLWLKRQDVKLFVDILESTFVFEELKPFYWKLSYEIKKALKGYLNDIWWINYFIWFFEIFEDLQWKIVENFIYNQLRAWIPDRFEIKFWQNKNKSEVDFVLVDSLEKKIIPIEAKKKSKDILPKSLISFINTYNDLIDFAVVTTDWINKIRQFNWKKVYFIDYRLIFKIRDFMR